MTKPREESVILGELAAVQEEADRFANAGDGFDLVRRRLEDLKADLEPAHADSSVPWSPPEWAEDVPIMAYKPGEILRRLDRALAELEEAERREPDAINSHLLLAACKGVVDPFSTVRRDDVRLAALRERLGELEDELEDRRKGPGEPRPYRLVHGKHGCADGRVVRPGGVLELTRWQAREFGERVEPVEEEAVVA